LDWFETIKTIVQLLLSISSLSFSIAIYRRTKQIRALDNSTLMDLMRIEMGKATEEHQVLMKTLEDLSSRIGKIERTTR
jgi:hypothetical protein